MYYSGYEIVKSSINNNQLKECLRGEGKYKYEDKNTSGPVDQSVILNAIYELYRKEPNLRVNTLFEEGLIDMINDDVEGIYLAIYYIYEQIGNEVKGISPFKINRLSVVDRISNVIKNRKTEIDNTNELDRLNVKGNILKKIYKINDFSIRKYGVAIL